MNLRVNNLNTSKTTVDKKRSLRQRIVSLVLTLVIVLACTTVSAVMWFRQSFEENVPPIPYEMRIQLIRDLNQPFVGENLLWTSGVLGVSSIDQTVSLDLTEKTTVYAMVSNLYGYEESVQCELEITQGGEMLLQRATVGKGSRFTLDQNQKSKIFTSITIEPSQEVRIQLRTALQNQKIYTVSTAEELTQKEYPLNSVVYLTQDVHIDGTLLFSKSFPHIVLSGFTLSCDQLVVTASQGVFHEMKISGGVMKAGNKQYTNTDTIESEGEGRVVLTFSDMR